MCRLGKDVAARQRYSGNSACLRLRLFYIGVCRAADAWPRAGAVVHTVMACRCVAVDLEQQRKRLCLCIRIFNQNIIAFHQLVAPHINEHLIGEQRHFQVSTVAIVGCGLVIDDAVRIERSHLALLFQA